jgi:tRNA A-37 threonylcarbamoyl transferase component Bud32
MPDAPSTHTPQLGPGPTLPPPLGGGRYVPTRVLGTGGMATVYLATDSMLQVGRAIKLLAPRYADHNRVRQRFLDEARTMARLRHPNIVTVFDVGMEGSRPFIVMELIEGGSLMDYIERHGPTDPSLAIEVMQGVLGGLQVAHDNGVIHRDIKPHNVLLADGGQPKVTDFGIARVEDRQDSLTKTGAMMGTLAYMAPEQRRNARGVGVGADIYAAGATLYVMLCGRDPFDLYSSDLHDEIFEGVQPDLAEVIKQACRYRAEHRYPSVAEFARALRQVAAALPELSEDELPSWGPMFRAAPTHDGQTAQVEEARQGATAVPAPSSHTFAFDAVVDKVVELRGRIGDTETGTIEGAEPTAPPPKPARVAVTGQAGVEPVEPEGSGTGILQEDADEDESRGPSRRALPWVASLMVLGLATIGGLKVADMQRDEDREDLTVPVEDLSAPVSAAPDASSSEPAVVEPPPDEPAGDAVTMPEELGEPAPAEEQSPAPSLSEPEPVPPPPVRSQPAREAAPVVRTPRPATPEPEPDPAVEPVTEAPTVGHGYINTRPFSNLVLDGVDRGLTGWNGELSPGDHSYTLTTTDGRTHSGTIAILAGEPTRFCWDFNTGADCS